MTITDENKRMSLKLVIFYHRGIKSIWKYDTISNFTSHSADLFPLNTV